MSKTPPHNPEYMKAINAAKGKTRTWKAAEERRARWLEGFTETLDIERACASVPVSRTTYHQWRHRFPEFKAKVEAIRVAGGKPADGSGGGPGELHNTRQPHVWTDGFGSFRKRFFGMDSPWFHLEIVEALEQAEPGRITLVLLPPEHGKTTLLEDFCGYKLATEPNFRITVGSEKETHSKKFLRRVRHRMEADGPFTEYVQYYGPFAPQARDVRKSIQPWGDKQFDVHFKSAHDERDYSMAALGITAGVQGTRTDLLIIDDVQSLKSLSSSTKYLDLFRQDWLSRPGSKAPTVLVGTRVGPDDFYEQLIGAGLVDRLIMYPAQDDDGQWLWPERYSPDEYTLSRRNVGEEAWARNYQQAPLDKEGGPFSQTEVDDARQPVVRIGDPLDPDTAGVVLGWDPGFGRNAFVAAAMLPDRLDVLDVQVDEGLRNTSQMFQVMADFLVTWPVTHVCIEDKAFQKGLMEDEDLLTLQRRFGFEVQGHDTGVNKRDPNIGVPGMARSLRRQEITIPDGDDYTSERMAELRTDLVRWRPGMRGTELRQDTVMGLWFCWIIWRDQKDILTFDDSAFRTQGLTFAPTKSGLVLPATRGSPLRG